MNPETVALLFVAFCVGAALGCWIGYMIGSATSPDKDENTPL